MKYRKLRIAWSVGCGIALPAADRVVGAELLHTTDSSIGIAIDGA